MIHHVSTIYMQYYIPVFIYKFTSNSSSGNEEYKFLLLINNKTLPGVKYLSV